MIEWGFIFGVCSICVTVCNVVILVAVKFNDLKHLDEHMHRHSQLLDELFAKTDQQGQRIARLEGKMNGNLPPLVPPSK